MKTYRVGQILFLISENNKVLPIQVVEEVVRTTLDGKEKTYIIKFPDKDSTRSDIKKVKGKLFESKESVFDFMIKNATNAINSMLESAALISSEVFKASIEKEEVEAIDKKEEAKEQPKMQPEAKQNKIITVDLGNGKYGKITQDELSKVGGDS